MAGRRHSRSNPAAPGFRLEEYPFYLLASVDHAYSQQMEAALRRIAMSRPRWRVLMSLRARDPRSVSELARMASMKLSNISRVVDGLRAEGLVSCAPRANDARVTEVRLEPPGREALEEIVRVAARQYERAVRGLGVGDIDRLNDLLRRIAANLAG